MEIRRSVTVATPVSRAFAYLADFTTTTEWDPGTVSTTRTSGDGGVGTTYHNVSRFLGRETELDYEVVERVEGERIVLVGRNATVTAEDTMAFTGDDTTTTLTYTARFTFSGLTRFLAPLLAPAFARLGNEAEEGLRRALNGL